MSKEIKRIPVESQEQAFQLIHQLSQRYGLKQDASRHQFLVSNERYSAYYDAEERVVKMETLNMTAEEIKEFLMEFPPFF